MSLSSNLIAKKHSKHYNNLNQKISSRFQQLSVERCLHVSAVASRVQSGYYKPTPKRNKPLTYEMAVKPQKIAHRKSWNSWNTSNMVDGKMTAEITFEDLFIRRFIYGTWPTLTQSEIIIKRQYNMIRISFIVSQSVQPRKMSFLIGYTEEFLSHWTHSIVKLELQSVADRRDVVFKYI